MAKIQVTNHSSHTLIYQNFQSPYRDNQFTIYPKTIQPGKSAIIIGETTPSVGLRAALRFSSGVDANNLLIIDDHRQMQVGQSTFSMNNSYTQSVVISETFNPIVDPSALMITAVTIQVKDKSM